PPVSPVEPRVMQEEIDGDRHRTPPPGIGVQPGIDASPAVLLPAPSRQPRGYTVDDGACHRPADLRANLPALTSIEARETRSGEPGESAAHCQITHCDDRGHGDRRKHQGEKQIHALHYINA